MPSIQGDFYERCQVVREFRGIDVFGQSSLTETAEYFVFWPIMVWTKSNYIQICEWALLQHRSGLVIFLKLVRALLP